MLEKGKIDSKQAVIFLLTAVLPTAILFLPAITVKSAMQDAWLLMVLAILAGLLIAWLMVSLSLRFPGKTLFEYAEVILGRVPGKIVGFLYIWLFFLYIGSGTLRHYGEFLVTTTMPDTPIIVFNIAAIVVAAYAVRNGLEVLCRYIQLFIPTTALMAVVFILSAKDMKLARLLPVFETGLIPIVKGSITPIFWIGEIIILAIIIPYLNKPKEAYRVAVLSTLLSGFFLTASILEALLIFGPNIAGYWIFPTYNAVRVVSVANFLERLESFLVVIWVLGGIAKLGVFYYAAVLGSAQCMGLKDYRPLVVPVGVILVSLSILLWGENIVEMMYLISQVYVTFSLIVFEVGIPLLLLIVALARGKGGKAVD